MKESSLKRRVKAWLDEQPDVFSFKVHGSIYGINGLPDICGNVGFAALYVELKAPGGKLSKIQEHRIAQIRKAGATVLVAESVEEVVAHVEMIRRSMK